MRITISIGGEPKPQPRPRARAFQASPGKWIAQIYNPSDCDGWKRMIELAAKPHVPSEPLEGPISIKATFFMERPKSHFLKAGLRTNAPTKHAQRPDFDNLIKAVMDACTDAGLWRDDALIADATIAKRWANKYPGVVIEIETSEPAQQELQLAEAAAQGAA